MNHYGENIKIYVQYTIDKRIDEYYIEPIDTSY